MKWISLLLVLGTMANVHAAKIAVIDSGLDYKHEMIVPNLWTNPLEVYDNRDNDGNGYQDDVHGWNFAEQNGQIIDYKYLGTFSNDPYKYFDIQGKAFLKKATEEELAWARAIVKDKKFIAEITKFGNFVHGTHVAGITIRDSQNEVQGYKLIPTEVKPFFERAKHAITDNNLVMDRWAVMTQIFDALAKTQMDMLSDIARLAASHGADVANGSFGMGIHQAKIISDNLYKILFFKKPSEEDSNKAARLLIEVMVKRGQDFVGSAPNTLFCFAAGNDGMSNDEYGTSPANIKADNVITVGATYKNEFFAPFSNYGTKMVDIAAPGMIIHSAIPGNGTYINISGTSQASPYVANVAAKIKFANPTLKPVDIKKILMGTVDKKGFLSDKVTTSGIVNLDRAVYAAHLTKSVPVAEAITRSRIQVKDAPVETTGPVSKEAITPIPLTPSVI
jgi:subtilisin family serine protease